MFLQKQGTKAIELANFGYQPHANAVNNGFLPAVCGSMPWTETAARLPELSSPLYPPSPKASRQQPAPLGYRW